MTEPRRAVLSLLLEDSPDAEIGRWLAALVDTRRRTHDALKDLDDSKLDEIPPSAPSSIGAVLYHVAAIEADWLFDDILGTQATDWPAELFPAEVRADGEHLSAFKGEALADHLSRLEKVRNMLVETIGGMTADELHRPRERANYDVSPAWVLHHLMQHEAEHRSQIGSVRESLGVALGW